MAQQTMTGRAGVATASAGTAPETGMRIVGALLALGVGAAHVADQGGVTAFTSPDWGDWVGTVSLFVEAALVLMSASMLLALRQRPSSS